MDIEQKSLPASATVAFLTTSLLLTVLPPISSQSIVNRLEPSVSIGSPSCRSHFIPSYMIGFASNVHSNIASWPEPTSTGSVMFLILKIELL